jgi:biopolymer transport protein ExbB
MIGSYKATLGDVAAQVLLLQSRDLDLNASSVKPVHAASKRAGYEYGDASKRKSGR